MKILGVSGSPVKRGTYYLLEQVIKGAQESDKKVETEIIHLPDYDLKFCQGCNNCLQKKECIIKDDDLYELGGKMEESDAIVFASPSYFGSVTAYLKNLMDRSRYLKMRDHALSDKLCAAVVSSGLQQGGGQSTVETINRFGLTHGMRVIGAASRPEFEANMVVGVMESEEGFRKVKDDKKAVKLAKNLGERLVK
ncbi:MAG: flavodoxin family protein [Halanaerobiales bacterium]